MGSERAPASPSSGPAATAGVGVVLRKSRSSEHTSLLTALAPGVFPENDTSGYCQAIVHSSEFGGICGQTTPLLSIIPEVISNDKIENTYDIFYVPHMS